MKNWIDAKSYERWLKSNDVVNVCYTRFSCELSCKDCIYYGKICEKFKHEYGVEKPYQLEDNFYQKGNKKND